MVIIMAKSDKNVLFITEKWCDADPKKGLTNNYHNLFKTFKAVYPDTKFSIVHLDEYSMLKKKHIDTFIPKLIDNLSPDIVVFSLLGRSHLNPTDDSYKCIKSSGAKTIFMWPDVFDGWGIPEIQELNDKGFADLHVCWGSERNTKVQHDNLVWLWAPQDETLYHPLHEKIEQRIPVSFLGSVRYPERQKYLQHLIDNKSPIYIDGGQREKGLSAARYAELMRNSKISLNFPQGPQGYDQCKGRVWEILASKSLLFERKNEAIQNFLKPGVHYVEFSDEQDLVDKIQYYLDNENERDYIINKGYKIFKKKFNATVFWESIMKEIDCEL